MYMNWIMLYLYIFLKRVTLKRRFCVEQSNYWDLFNSVLETIVCGNLSDFLIYLFLCYWLLSLQRRSTYVLCSSLGWWWRSNSYLSFTEPQYKCCDCHHQRTSKTFYLQNPPSLLEGYWLQGKAGPPPPPPGFEHYLESKVWEINAGCALAPGNCFCPLEVVKAVFPLV